MMSEIVILYRVKYKITFKFAMFVSETDCSLTTQMINKMLQKYKNVTFY